MNNIVSIWDADFIPYYVCHNKKLDNGEVENKSLQDCKNLVDQFIGNVNLAINADQFLIVLTVGKCFRYQVYPEYKANRKYGNKPKWFDEIKEYLITHYKATYNTKYEADDLVCIYKNKLSKEGYDCYLVSPDKDILNLEGKHYNPRENQWVNSKKELSERWKWYQMIIGDSIDGLPGIKGIGEKGANKLLDEQDITQYRNIIFNKYCEVYGEEHGIEMFFKMYKCLTMVQNDNTIEVPKLISLERKISEEKGLFE